MRRSRSVWCGLSLWSLLCAYLSTITAGASSSHFIVDGCSGSTCGKNSRDNGKPVECASDDATKGSTMGDTDTDNIAVQCCAIDASSADRPGCVEGVTFDVAEAHCESVGLRLCTKDEVLTDMGRKTGCGFSNDHVWTSTACSLSSEPSLSPETTPSEAAAWKLVKQGAFACTDDYSGVFSPRPSPTDVSGNGCYASLDLNAVCVAACEKHCEGKGTAFAELWASQCTCFDICPFTPVSTPIKMGIMKRV